MGFDGDGGTGIVDGRASPYIYYGSIRYAVDVDVGSIYTRGERKWLLCGYIGSREPYGTAYLLSGSDAPFYGVWAAKAYGSAFHGTFGKVGTYGRRTASYACSHIFLSKEHLYALGGCHAAIVVGRGYAIRPQTIVKPHEHGIDAILLVEHAHKFAGGELTQRSKVEHLYFGGSGSHEELASLCCGG
jgi:hypothetical protein